MIKDFILLTIGLVYSIRVISGIIIKTGYSWVQVSLAVAPIVWVCLKYIGV